jgi:hypothetical protein
VVWRRWRRAPLDLSPAFKVFSSSQGAQGILGLASKQQLDTVFGTHNDIDVVTKILKEGREQGADGIRKGGLPTSLNVTRGSDVPQ